MSRRPVGIRNQLVGSEPQGWRTSRMEEVAFHGVRPNLDIRYSSSRGSLTYALHLARGSNPANVHWRVRGVDHAGIGPDGTLQLEVQGVSLHQSAPVAYQERNGIRTLIQCRYRLQPRPGGMFDLGYLVGPYDATATLVIDPPLQHGSFYGGDQFDTVLDSAMDASGRLYVAGWTRSPLLPGSSTPGPANSADAFIARFNASGTAVEFVTFLGGSDHDQATGLAVHTDGSLTVVGWTRSSDFPVASGSQAALGGGQDAFVARLSTNGTLLGSTYLGGSGDEQARDVALDGAGNAILAGFTTSNAFPGVSSQSAQAQRSLLADAFVSKVNAAGATLAWSTYLGGTGADQANAIAVEPGGTILVAGTTASANLPGTSGSVQPQFGGGVDDGFLARLGSDGTQLLRSTYYGGGGSDSINAVAIGPQGEWVLAGHTNSPTLPGLSPGALQSQHAGGGYDGFFARSSAGGGSVLNATFLGGEGSDTARALSLDGAYAYVAGHTTSSALPLTTATRPLPGGPNLFVAKLALDGSTAPFGAFFGPGAQPDTAAVSSRRIAGAAVVYVAGGATASLALPRMTTGPLYAFAGDSADTDAFVARLTHADLSLSPLQVSNPRPLANSTVSLTAQVLLTTASGLDSHDGAMLRITLPPGLTPVSCAPFACDSSNASVLGPVAPGQTVTQTYELRVGALSPGTALPIRVDVDSLADDPDEFNQTQSATLIVESAPNPCAGTSLSAAAHTLGIGATSGSVVLTTQAGCAWTAASDASWLRVTNGSTGTGSRTLQYVVDAAPIGTLRSGTLTVAGQRLTVTQDCRCAGVTGWTVTINPLP